MQLEDIRREYRIRGLSQDELNVDPILQFQKWMQEALVAKLIDPTAMVVATSDSRGRCNSRTVLLKGLDSRGFVFYTSYESVKSSEIDQNPSASLLFPWHSLERQVRVNGEVLKISREETLEYFRSRPRESQIAAWASRQSAVIASREQLITRYEELEDQFQGGDVPLPDNWGGYRVVPDEIEFWQGRENRLHDRFRYLLSEGQWQINRLSP